MSIVNLLIVGTGGFFGAIARYSFSQFINKQHSTGLPLATLIINLAGSFLLGLMFGLEIAGHALLLLGTGFMGAFTTFSTFTFEGTQLLKGKRQRVSLLYIVFSCTGGIAFAFLGLAAGRHLL